MPIVEVNEEQIIYTIEGEGFPLVLLPDTDGHIADWCRQLPLLGELCRVIAYEYGQSHTEKRSSRGQAALVDDLISLCDTLAIKRAYLAGYADGGLTALHAAWRYPERSQGLLLIGLDHGLSAIRLSEIAIPTGILIGAQAPAHIACATFLASHLADGSHTIIPDAAVAPHHDQPLPLGHAMLSFLSQCERQRNLVRGASFLL